MYNARLFTNQMKSDHEIVKQNTAKIPDGLQFAQGNRTLETTLITHGKQVKKCREHLLSLI